MPRASNLLRGRMGSVLPRFSPRGQVSSPSLTLLFRPDELYRVPTDDGCSVALGRYHPRGERRFREPVILCHGLGANRFNLDFDEKLSLARYLAHHGYESWVLELRGRGLAGPEVNSTFDDQAEYDVRAALRTVVSTQPPGTEVLWVGHSKGGLLLFGHLAKNPDAPVRAAVALGSPITFAVQPGLIKFLERIDPLLNLGSIPAHYLGRFAVMPRLPTTPLTRYLLNAENTDPWVMRQALANMASPIPGGVGKQFGQWIRTGRFDSADGSFDYRANLKAVRFPVLLLAGSKDLLAPPLAALRASEFLGGPVKTMTAGTAHGFSADYGHGDLVIGRKAPDEIFPLVESFLAGHATRV